MSKEKAIKVIESLRDYAFENWDEIESEKELDGIEEAVGVIRRCLFSSNLAGSAEIGGKKYLIMEE